MSIYFPLLRWKLGERSALANLTPAVKNQINPIIEFPPDCDYNDQKLLNFCDTTVNDWGINLPFFLDLSSVDYDGAPNGTNHPALALLGAAHQRQLTLLPIISLNMDPDLFIAIQQAYRSGYCSNIALRITEEEEDTAANDASEMIRDLGVKQSDVDLVIDLRDVSNGAIRVKIRSLNALVAQFGTGYRRSIVLSGAIPGDLGNYIGTDDDGYIPRHDWRLWLQTRRIQNLNHLLFGDYTTIPCEFRDIPYMGAPKAKYTLEEEWFVIKGHRARGRDNQRQMQALVIVNSNFYRGPQYSFGDNRIYQCSDGSWGPGNPTNWVTNDINQHITFVRNQVSAILAAP